MVAVKVNEVFEGFQGEGTQMGKWCTFIRFQGCSANCSFCDSKSTWSEATGEYVDVESLVDNVRTQNVCITGGEPTEQDIGLKTLIGKLKQKGCTVWLESNGSYYSYKDFGCDWVVVSPKVALGYSFYSEGVDELKYVVTREFEESLISESVREKFKGRIWLQPCDYGEEGANKEMYKKVVKVVQQNPDVFRAGIQLHKVYGER